MKPFRVLTDPQGFQLLADNTRRKMVHLLRAKEYTVSQIAAEMGLTPQAIYHHVRKMKDAGILEVAREERVDHFIETYYRAAAEVFFCFHGESDKCDRPWSDSVKGALKAFGKLGLGSDIDDALATKVLDVRKKMESLGDNPDLEKRVAEIEDLDLFTTQTLIEYARVVTMTDEEFEQFLELQREARRLLTSDPDHSAKPESG